MYLRTNVPFQYTISEDREQVFLLYYKDFFEQICSDVQFISPPEEVGEFLLHLLKWQAFVAFCASAIFKESLLGVLNTLYGTGGNLVSSTFGAKAAGSSADISSILAANFSQAEGLAFIFAISFNMPCVSALAATARETHSVKWTAKIGVFYTLAALLVSCVVYHHIGLVIFP